MPYCTLNDDTRLHYESSGTGNPVLLIHGWSFNSRVWKGQIEQLKNYFQVIAVDVRGHGKSETGKDGFSLQQVASDLDKILKKLELNEVNVVGWSMGGSIAIRLFTVCPERLKSFTLVSTTPSLIRRDGFPAALPLAVVKRLKTLVKRDPVKAFRDFRGMILSGKEEGLEHIADVKEILTREVTVSKEVAEKSLVSLMEEDLRELLDRISLPTLIIHGDTDQICLPEAAFYLQEKVRGSRLLMLKGCGHAPFLTFPLQFHEELTRFLHSL
jgi:pimeloyl-[acyl-carrier protein] methyl ester esterase